MRWVIRCISDKTLYWNCNNGWMTTSIKYPDELHQYAEVYSDIEKEMNNLPVDGEWVILEKGE